MPWKFTDSPSTFILGKLIHLHIFTCPPKYLFTNLSAPCSSQHIQCNLSSRTWNFWLDTTCVTEERCLCCIISIDHTSTVSRANNPYCIILYLSLCIFMPYLFTTCSCYLISYFQLSLSRFVTVNLDHKVPLRQQLPVKNSAECSIALALFSASSVEPQIEHPFWGPIRLP